MNKVTSLVIIITLLVSCKQNEQPRPLVTALNVYNVILENDKPKMGKPLYKEAFEYNEEGRISQHFQYNELGELKSREIYPEVYGDMDTIKTSFYDANNILQSNYLKIFNSDKLKTEVLAYEANTNELLRKEKYVYDSDNNLISKKVYTADDLLYRHQKFQYDGYGNESKVSIYNEEGTLIFEEEYDITTYDGKKMWKEKWGYRNGEPVSFRKRVLEY